MSGLTARLSGPRPWLDPRAHVFRSDFADIALVGELAAHHYVQSIRMRCAAPRTPVRKADDAGATAVSELLAGEEFDLFDIAGDWGFGRSAADRYTGWVALAALADPGPAPAHRISARVAPVFSAADIKAPVLMELPFGARVAGEARDKFLALAEGGFVHLRHIASRATTGTAAPATPIEVARLFTGAPYLWGGRTPLGVDCSGLVQAALTATGTPCPRDSDQQLAAVGTAVDFDDRAAGDLVFFPGHVGILATRDRLFHANAHWMSTVEEPLDDVIARLHAAGIDTPVTGVRRLA